MADLLAVLDALQIGRIILVGHSIAGNELTLFAGSHPRRVRGLMYLDTTFDYLASGGYEEPEAPPLRRTAARPGRPGIAGRLDRVCQTDQQAMVAGAGSEMARCAGPAAQRFGAAKYPALHR